MTRLLMIEGIRQQLVSLFAENVERNLSCRLKRSHVQTIFEIYPENVDHDDLTLAMKILALYFPEVHTMVQVQVGGHR